MKINEGGRGGEGGIGVASLKRWLSCMGVTNKTKFATLECKKFLEHLFLSK